MQCNFGRPTDKTHKFLLQDEAPVDGWLQLLFETTPFTMREAAQMEQELPQQSGRPVLHQARPHIMMAKSQPKQHGDPGFMQRKSGQANHKASFAGTAGTIHGTQTLTTCLLAGWLTCSLHIVSLCLVWTHRNCLYVDARR